VLLPVEAEFGEGEGDELVQRVALPGGDDEVFARDLLARYNVTVLPGSYLARSVQGINPGAGRVRMALVAETEECVEAAKRIVNFVKGTTG